MAAPSTKEVWFDYGNPDLYPPDLYDYQALAESNINGFDAVSDEHISLFHQQGYLVVHEAFTQAEVQVTLDAFLELIAGKRSDFKGIMFEKKAAGVPIETLPPEQKQDYIRKFASFVEYDEWLKTLSEHPKLIHLLTRIMGEPPQLFQDMALIKPPEIGREKPWHQDLAYFDLPLETVIVGVWIALDEATVDNGCMVIRPGSHLQGPIVHFQRRDWQICDTHVGDKGAVAVPLKPGGCLLFHSLLHHGTPANASAKRRRAVQFHYKPGSAQQTSAEERLAVFGEEGKDVTC